MRQEAELDQEVLVVGARSHIEIWNPEHWNWNRQQIRSGLDRMRAWPNQAFATQQGT
jgi:DNA-binding transcriptional regulator/RsmH inhibitor MraZ